MPIYEYRCEKCGRQLEVIQKFSDKPLATCSSCHGKLTKLVSQASFQLKGSGWYVTDYAKKSESKSDVKKDESVAKSSSDVKKDESFSKSSAEAPTSSSTKTSVDGK